MTLRRRLLLAQLPLALAVIALVALAFASVGDLGRSAERILADNQKSVHATLRMNEAIERLDSAALLVVGGRRDFAEPGLRKFVPEFEDALRVQAGNVTEEGEQEATDALAAAWRDYRGALDRLVRTDTPSTSYFDELEPRFRDVKARTSRILSINQGAMERKSDAARAEARRTERLVLLVGAAALLLGVAASALLTTRILRPLRALRDAAGRIAEGKLDARAPVVGSDEIGALSREFNAMAERIAALQASTLGDLLDAQAASQAAIDAFPDPVVVFRPDGSLIFVNEAADQILGTARGSDPLAGLEPRLRAAVVQARDHVLSGRGPWLPEGFESAVVVQDAGGERAFLPRATPMRLDAASDGGRASGVALILQDVTRLRRFDQLREDLVATVAHEFRTPLTSLHMAIHLCLEGAAGPLTEKQADLLQASREDCERLQQMVDDLLELAALQAGAPGAARRRVRALELLEETEHAHGHAAELRSVRLAVEPPVDGLAVDVTPDAVQMALANLVSNAVRHSPPGGVVTLSAREDGESVRFSVTDEGPGIAAEMQDRLFRRFSRLPGTPRGGSGLGLSIVRRVVESHGGEVGVDSEPGRGAAFWFRLPRAAPQTP